MSTLKRTKVVMLPTEKAENCLILKQGVGNKHLEFQKGYFTQEYLQSVYSKAFHLYIISDEEIKEGDYFLSNTGAIMKNDKKSYAGFISRRIVSSDKKIIATTDSSLVLNPTHYTDGTKRAFHTTEYLPQPSNSFIEVFVKEYNKGNVITNVMIEYEQENMLATANRQGNYDYVCPNCKAEEHNLWYSSTPTICTNCSKLKVDKNNTITIKRVKDSWNREEVSKLLFAGMNEAVDFHGNGHTNHSFLIENWIEKNL